MSDNTAQYLYNSTHFAHYGVRGMKWGVRRYDGGAGSNSPAGKRNRVKRRLKQAGAVAATGVAAYAIHKGAKYAKKRAVGRQFVKRGDIISGKVIRNASGRASVTFKNGAKYTGRMRNPGPGFSDALNPAEKILWQAMKNMM